MRAASFAHVSAKGTGALKTLTFALLLLATNSACSKSITYTYVDVHVTIDPDTVDKTRLYLVTGCEVHVIGPDVAQPFNIRCPENRVRYDVGTFQWTSRASTGTLAFQVRIVDANQVILGEGTSEAVSISPGKHLNASVLVRGLSPTDGTEAGADGGTDGGTITDPDAGADTAGMGTGIDTGAAPNDGPAEQSDVRVDADANGDADSSGDVTPNDQRLDSTLEVGASDIASSDGFVADAPNDAVADNVTPADSAGDIPADTTQD